MRYEKLVVRFSFLLVLVVLVSPAFATTKVYPGQYLVTPQVSLFSNTAPQVTLVDISSGQSIFSTMNALDEYDEQKVTEDCADLRAELGDVDCEPNAYWEVSAVPDDTKYSQLYGMKKMNAPAAWDVSTGSYDVIVAVLDTGVDYTHPDLQDNMWTNPREIAGNGIDDDGNGYVDDIYGVDFYNNDSDPYDDHMHGTHVAGTIGAKGNNGLGVVGVNWNVSIMAIKFLSSGGGGSTLDAVTGIDYAILMGAQVINASFGGTYYSEALFQAVKRYRDAGGLFVAAAGNSNNDNDSQQHYPSGYALDNVISVAAVDQNDDRAWFSNYGATSVDIAAPGVSILSTLPGGTYGNLSGTSMASPHIAGVAALVLSMHPEYSAIQVKNLLMNTVDPISSLSGVVASGGRVNVAAALGSQGTPGSGVGSGDGDGDGVGSGNGSVSINLTIYRGRRMKAVTRDGNEGETAMASLMLKNRFGTEACELGEVALGSTTVFKLGKIPSAITSVAFQVDSTLTSYKRNPRKSRRRTRNNARALATACSKITPRVRQLTK